MEFEGEKYERREGHGEVLWCYVNDNDRWVWVSVASTKLIERAYQALLDTVRENRE